MEITRTSLLVRVRDVADASAWQEFASIYQPILARFARARGLSATDVDDTVQHCMTVLVQHLRTFEYDPKRGRFRGWLRTVVNNHVRKLWRDRREEQPGSSAFSGLKDTAETPDDEFDRIWMQEHLHHCLERIRGEVPAERYEAFRTHVILEATVEDTCQRFGLTPDQLYKLKWKMTRRLSEVMRDQFGDDIT